MLYDLTRLTFGDDGGDRGDAGSSFFSSGGRNTPSAKADGGALRGESKCLKAAGVAVCTTGGGVAGGLKRTVFLFADGDLGDKVETDGVV